MSFHRVLVGIDGSPEAAEALRQGRALRAADGRLLALAVAETHLARHAGMDGPEWIERLETDAEAARQEAAAALGDEAGTETRADAGYPAELLLETAAAEQADLLVVGSHGTGRVAGIAFGSVATRVVHDAHCSVLVARATPGGDAFPGRIVTGTDGSEHAADAVRIARGLARETGASLEIVENAGDAVDELKKAGASAGLVVVGSRGLHGLAALGSVAERVAHQAPCSVLVVR